MSGSTCFKPTLSNTSCTGGTISDIFVPATDENSEVTAYLLTIKELRSFNGFKDVSQEEADRIIRSLYQLSVLTYQVLNNE